MTLGESLALKFAERPPTELLVHIEYLNGERAWVPLDELDRVRRAFRFVPPGKPA